MLTDTQITHYHDHGYLLLGTILDPPLLAAMQAEEARIRDFQPYEEGTTIFRSQMANYSAVVRQVITSDPLVQIAQQLIGPNICHWFNQFVTKLPDAHRGKSEFPWHQDNGYVSIEPPTNVTIWIALDDVDEQNGCVWVQPKSHQQGLLDHRTKGDSWHLTLDVDGDGIPAILKAGQAIAFTGLTLHRSKLNHTHHPRRGFFIEYADPTAHYSREADRQAGNRHPLTTEQNTWLLAGQIPWKPTTP